jgi:hypothetical protein
LVNFYQTTRCYNPEDSNLLIHLVQDRAKWWAIVNMVVNLKVS